MKKTTLIITVIMILCALLSCGGEAAENENVVIDIERLALELSAGLPFDDELIRLDDQAVALKYAFGGDSAVVYAGSGATPEIVIAVQCSDPEAAADAVFKIDAFIKEQIILFTDYNSSQLPKLKTAYLNRHGRYAVCAVSSDSSDARTITESCETKP
ncbi:MAG: DUF4358 domain-containing protein [Eubacteriales bacterium]|jgi:hypothetical protein|nr:DUF4358 domain-containing protein [Eubacteriales bacterium]